MTRFFIPTTQFAGDRIVLNGTDRHHLLTVLRKEIGDEVLICNGKGQEFLARIQSLNPTEVLLELTSEVSHPVEPKVRINLVQSLPKADKFEWILQKNTELGVSHFQPVITERSIVKLDATAMEKKYVRWQTIIREAAEQAGRRIIPELALICRWPEVLKSLPTGITLIPWEGERELTLKRQLEKVKDLPETVNILIGPEGGFSIADVTAAQAAGAIPVTLGPRILRTETAGLVVASVILYHFGDLG